MTAPTDVLTLAMKLPEKERATIAHELLLSLEPEVFDDDEVSAAWQQEIESRLQKMADGRHQTHDWRQTLQEIRAELKQETQP
jgi:putative addiction module component (TIGR02574 family)